MRRKRQHRLILEQGALDLGGIEIDKQCGEITVARIPAPAAAGAQLHVENYRETPIIDVLNLCRKVLTSATGGVMADFGEIHLEFHFERRVLFEKRLACARFCSGRGNRRQTDCHRKNGSRGPCCEAKNHRLLPVGGEFLFS